MYGQPIKERVRELHEEGVSVQEIKDIMQKEAKEVISTRTIYSWIGAKEEDECIDTMNESVPTIKHYTYTDTHYIFVKKEEDPVTGEKESVTIKVPIGLVDNIFLHYSAYGKNWSKQQIIDKFGIKDEVFNLLKGRLKLTKFCGAKSPLSLERAEENGTLDEEIEEFTSDVLKDKYKEKLVKTHEKEFKKIAIKAMSRTLNQDYVIDELQKVIEAHQPIQVDFPKKPPYNSGIKIVAFGDLHVGRTTEELEKRMGDMLEKLKVCPEATIVLVNLGDNWENVMMGSQLMHDSQQLEIDHTGSKQMLKSVDIIENFVKELCRSGKLVRYHGVVHSNHDRINKHNDADPEHILAIAFNMILERGLKSFISEFSYYTQRVFSFEESGINFIVSHGDLGFDKKSTEQILQLYGKYGMHNICLSGHLHQSKLEEGTGYTRVSVPSMNSGNIYSREIIISEAAPGYVEIKANEYGTADILFKRL